MPIRDARAVEAASQGPFPGYAVHGRAGWSVDTDRVAACVAILGTMVVSGIVLGRTREPVA